MSDSYAHSMPASAVVSLMHELIDMLRARLREKVTATFDTLDDTLFEMGERARSGEARQHHFDSLRECRRQRGMVQDYFLAALGHRDARPAEDEQTPNAQLSLVAPEDLEEELAIDGMASRVAQRLSASLYVLDQRVGWLLGDPDMDEQRNPLSPLMIGKAFRNACLTLEIDMHARLVLFKIFERQVLGALEDAYVEINTRLAAAGVLPIIASGHGRPRTTAHAQPRTETVSRKQSPGGARAHAAEAPVFELHESDLFAALRALLTREIEANMIEAQPSMLRTRPAAEVMDRALARLRTRPLTGTPLPPPRMLAAQLLAEARYADDSLPPSPQQAATVDIVGRVFDALAHDRSVPTQMQPVMQTLLLPVMRASLRHPGMIVESSHPLRQLLDLVAENAIGWCPSVDPGERALSDLRNALQEIAGSENNQDADRTAAQLRSQLEQQRRRAELAEQRAVEAHAGRERLWQARRQVHQALTQIVANATIPTWVRYLVTRPWMNCLVLLWLRQGPESQAYREALGFAESLVWCATAGNDPVEQLRLRALLPVMESQLRQGLATVAYQDSEIRQLVNELQQYVRYRIGDLPAPAFIEAEPPAANTPGALATDPDSIEEQPLPQNVNPDQLARIRALRPGTWFEFGKEAASSERARLSWISPYSGRCLFVNRNGLKIRERRPEDLAHEVENGLASIVENTQLLQRALAHVLAQLRNDAAGEAKIA
ncbi:MAG TPA: DUF1631 family protein [Xanthomonadaceae bacterium]|nr:DUF1631 family protein [Xanthomonadaceae bacterium]